MFLKGHIVQVGHPVALYRSVSFQHAHRSDPVEGFGFDLDQIQDRTVLDQDIGPDEQVPIADRRFVEDHRFLFEQLPSLCQGLLMFQCFDLMAAGEKSVFIVYDTEFR